MKHKKIAEALGEIDHQYIAQAANPKRPRWGHWAGAAAAILAAVLLLQLVLQPTAPGKTILNTNPTVQGTAPADLGRPVSIQSPDALQLVNLVAAPTYPQMVVCPNYDDYANKAEYDKANMAWAHSQGTQYDQPDGYADSLSDFWRRSLREFLSGQTENAVYSPVNVYMAMAMLAETADGNSRQQILELFGVDSIEALRTQAGHMWNAHYSADGATTTVLGNSIWLDSGFKYKQDVVDTLAENYYASVFHGDLGTENMNKQLRQWIDSQTGGLLQKQTAALELDPRTVMALASTIYFSATWENTFSETKTSEAIFHGADTDIRTQFMNQTFNDISYYRDEDFGAIRLDLTGENDMWLILPDEGKTVDDVLASGEYLQMCTGSWKDQALYKVHLSLPKFDVSGQMDLIEGMKKLGVTDIFDRNLSDFSAISEDGLYVSKIDHACRVAVDEEGCVAAGYTVVELRLSGLPGVEREINFTLDRPFLFVITSRDRLPLFAGVVNAP